MLRVVKKQVRALEHAFPLDVDVVWAINEDVGNRTIVQQGFNWSQAKELVHNFVNQLFTFFECERRPIALKQIHPRNRKDFKLAVSQAALDGVRRLLL